MYSSDSAHWTGHSSRVSLYDLCASRPSTSNEAVDHLSKNLGKVSLQRLETLGGFDQCRQSDIGCRKADDKKSRSPSASSSRSSNDVGGQSSRATTHSSRAPDKRTFQHWMRSLRRRAMHRSSVQSVEGSTADTDGCGSQSRSKKSPHLSRRRRLSSDSSLAFITAVRSASVSLASASVVARSRRAQARSQGRSRTDRSSRASFAGPRISEDSAVQEKFLLPDIDAIQRAAQRRRILEELIATEESYIGDLRFLMNVGSVRPRLAGLADYILGIHHHSSRSSYAPGHSTLFDQPQSYRDPATTRRNIG